MTDETQAKFQQAKRYHALKQRLFFVHLFVNIVFLSVFLMSGLSVVLRNFSAGFSENFFAANAVYLMIFGVLMYLLDFPLSYLEGFAWEHRFHLSNQKFAAWFFDYLKSGVVSGIVFLIAVETVYIFLRYSSMHWWIWATVFWLLLSIVLARLVPNVIIPLFYKYSAIDNASLKDRILKIFEKCRLKIKDAYQIDFSTKTKKANAMICGVGNNRRVILADTLINNFTVEEIEAVVAHEIGHYKNHDIVRLAVFQSLITLMSFYFADKFLRKFLVDLGFARLDDIAFFPMLALVFVILGFFLLPAINAYSRLLETKADLFSLRSIERPQVLASAFRQLGDMNLSDFAPGRLTEILFYDHPPLSKRIKMAESYSKS